MTIDVGVDLGTTFTAAAVARDGRVEMVELGNRANSVPSVVFAEEDGTLVVGEAALRRSAAAPGRLAREYKRRMGDPTPLRLGSDSFDAGELTAAMLGWVVDVVSEREGESPRRLMVAHPANWGGYKQDLLRNAIEAASLDASEVGLITEPEAAVVHYAAQARVPTGAVIAVYDLGGGTFDAAVVRKTDEGAEILGQPEGIERLGGIDFDEAVFSHVVASLGSDMPSLAEADDTTLAAAARLRDECVRAKEALSTDTAVDIPVLLPSVHTQVRLTRAEFEAMIRTPLAATIAALQRALRSADVSAESLDSVLLVGGSSRIPLVGEMVGAELGRPVAVDAHPKHAVALGAALAAAGAVSTEEAAAAMGGVVAGGGAAAAGAGAALSSSDGGEVEGAADEVTAVVAATAAAPGGDEPTEPVPVAVGGQDDGGGGPPWLLIGLGVIVAALIVGGIIAFAGGGDGGEQQGLVTGTPTPEVGETPGVTPEPQETPAPTEAPTPTSAPTSTPTATPTETPTATPTPEPVCLPSDTRCIEMTSVAVDGDALLVEWEANGFTPSVSDGFHAHFFWNTFEPEQVGTNAASDFGAVQGDWAAVDAQPWRSTDDGMGLSARPAGADEICVLVGTSVHAVDDPSVVQCLPLPV